MSFSADFYLAGAVLSGFASQAFAGNAKSQNNGKSGDNKGNGGIGENNGKSGENQGNGGKSGNAPAGSSNNASNGKPVLSRGQGQGLLYRLTLGRIRTLIGNSENIATGAPMQLLPSQMSTMLAEADIVWPPRSKPAELANLPDFQSVGSAIGPVVVDPPEPKLAVSSPAALAQESGAVGTKGDGAQTDDDLFAAAATMIEADSSFNATVEAFKMLNDIVEAFDRAENQPTEE